MNIPETGIVKGLSSDEYHRGPGVSSTGIKRILKSPLHYKDAIDQAIEREEKGEPEPITEAFEFGRQYHTYILEPDLWEATTAEPLDPELLVGTIKTVEELKAALKERALPVGGKRDELIERLIVADRSVRIHDHVVGAHAHENKGREIVSPETVDKLAAMKAMLMSDPTCAHVFQRGVPEVSMYWVDEETGIQCKIRPDWTRALRDGETFLVDLKSTIDATYSSFSRSMHSFGYHISAAMYVEGYQIVQQQDISERFLLVAQEKSRPYCVKPYLVDETALEIGKAKFHEALRLLKHCLDMNEWPGYDPGIENLSLPRYAVREAGYE